MALTEADIERVCEVMAEHGLSLKRACGAAGVSHSAVTRAVYRQGKKAATHPEWYERFDEARGKALLKLDQLGKEYARTKNSAGVTYVTKQQFAMDPRHRPTKPVEERAVVVNIMFGGVPGGEPKQVEVVQIRRELKEGSVPDGANETDPD